MKTQLCLILWIALVAGQDASTAPVDAPADAPAPDAPPAAAAAGDAPAANTRGFFGPGGGFGGGGQFGGGQFGGGQFGGGQFGGGQFGGGQFGGGFGGQPGFNGGFNGGGGFLDQAPPASCRFWCRTPQGQAYCCETADQLETPVFSKPGLCPPIRDTCPLRSFGPPSPCSNDGACSGVDKCCFDTCLQQHVCKPPRGFGRR